MALLYSDEKSVLERNIELETVKEFSQDEIEFQFEFDRCVEWISSNHYSRICLQFPDNLLPYSVDVANHLQQKSCKNIFILGDTAYGSCCVDEISASHVNADAIIHYGHSCLSKINRLPVLYVFTKNNLNLEEFLNHLQCKDNLSNDNHYVILYDTCYAHCFDDIFSQKLEKLNLSISLSTLNLNKYDKAEVKVQDKNQVVKFGRQYKIPADNRKPVIYIYLSDNICKNLENFIISMPENQFEHYTPNSNSTRSAPDLTKSIVRKHLFLCEKVKDAQVIGILVASLVVDQYLTAVNHIKHLCKKHQKRSYIISVGKPNSAKLANFPEIDLYVMVSCPEMSLPDAKEFLQPIVTLMDIELALNPSREWQSRINRDFVELLPGGSEYIPCPDKVPSGTDISLLNNSIRCNGVKEEESSSEVCSSVAIKAKQDVSIIKGREGLTEKSWQGLEQNLGMTPVSVITEGRSGTPATGYTTLKNDVERRT